MLDFKLGIPYSYVFHIFSILNPLESHHGYIFCSLLCDTFSIVYYSSPGILAFEGQYLDRPSQDIWECVWIRFYFDATMIEKEGVIVSYFSRLSITYFSWLYWGDNFFSVLILFSFTSEYVCTTQNKVMTALGDDLSTWENGNQQFCLDWAWTSLESMAVVWPYYVAGTKKLLVVKCTYLSFD